jgi:hypothetical protein
MLVLSTAYQMVHQYPMFGFVQMPDGKLLPFNGADAPFSGGKLDLVPGSFNPLHDAHRSIFDHIENPSKTYELAIERVNKGGMTIDDLTTRLSQFKGYAPILVLKHPLFIHKIGALYPWELTFHVGIDTASRIIESSPTVEVQGMRARFLVYDRKIEGRRWGLDDIPEPRPKNFIKGQALDETLLGISSTAIRSAAMQSVVKP